MSADPPARRAAACRHAAPESLRGVTAAFGIALLIAAAAPAASGKESDPSMSEWYERLTQPATGNRCCSMADCRPYDARMRKDYWEIFIYGEWMPVPNEVVLRTENILGSAVACLSTTWNYAWPPPHFAIHVLCFVPPPAT